MNNITNIKEDTHILTNNYITSTDTHKTGLNNNVLIFGPSGAGKTRHYVKPNILNSNGSMIISDTKGNLYEETGPVLRDKGYVVHNISLADFSSCTIGYNPLDYVGYDPETNKCSDKDILSLTHCLVSDYVRSEKNPFWEHASKQYLSFAINCVLEMLPVADKNLGSVMRILDCMDLLSKYDYNGVPYTKTRPNTEKRTVLDVMMYEWVYIRPDSSLIKKYKSICENRTAEKMHCSIKGITSTALHPLTFDEAIQIYKQKERIRFEEIGKKKFALFLTISDTDRSMDPLANAMMTQAIQTLCKEADSSPGNRLHIPVRFYLDDFATNLFIPDFDKIISVIRSREISVSVILQSITQLNSLYGDDRAKTIMNNCDRQLYLGGQDIDTASYVSTRTNKPVNKVLSMNLDEAYLFIRGKEPVLTKKYEHTGNESENIEMS